MTPEEVGLARSVYEDVAGGPPEANAETTRRILAGEPAVRPVTSRCSTPGAAIYAAGRVDGLEPGVRAAEAAIDSGAAAQALDRLVRAHG